MDCGRIGLGIAAWFLGIVVPVMHHVLLHWPLADQWTDNAISRSEHVFRSLPRVDWVYFIAMAATGAILVASGLRGEKARDKD